MLIEYINGKLNDIIVYISDKLTERQIMIIKFNLRINNADKLIKMI